jgi:hypothetical protein
MPSPRWLFPLALPLVLLTVDPPRRAAASICEIEQKPAATLLLPYFEVDTVNPSGINTLLSIHNASNRRDAVAKVEVWSEMGVAVGGFSVYLRANGAQLLDLRKVLDCKLPTAGPPPGTPYSASCSGAFPPLPANCTVFQWKKSLTGQPSAYLGGQCAGSNHGDGIARGYVTVDMMNVCTTQYQGSVGYFGSGGTGAASNLNQLWGEYSIVDSALNQAFGDSLVHVEASASDPRTSTAGVYTFYGKFVGWAGTDNREPLAATQRARFVTAAPFDGGTDLLVWRDSKSLTSAFACGGAPIWYPLGQSSLLFFAMNGALSANLTASTALGRVAQRVHVGGASLPVPAKEGWVNLTFNTTVAGTGPVPPANPNLDQGWLTAVANRPAAFQAGASGIQISSACTP